MEVILNCEDLNKYINNEDEFEDFEYINLFASFQESSSSFDEEEANIYYSIRNNYENKNEDVKCEIKYQIKNINKQINSLNYKRIVKRTNINEKIQKKKEKEFKSKIQIFENMKNKTQKISYYMNASERKQRKLMKILDKKKERMKKILLNKMIKKKINFGKKIINQNNIYFHNIFVNDVKVEKLICSYLGRKRKTI